MANSRLLMINSDLEVIVHLANIFNLLVRPKIVGKSLLAMEGVLQYFGTTNELYNMKCTDMK